jgi:hypothetical protein
MSSFEARYTKLGWRLEIAHIGNNFILFSGTGDAMMVDPVLYFPCCGRKGFIYVPLRLVEVRLQPNPRLRLHIIICYETPPRRPSRCDIISCCLYESSFLQRTLLFLYKFDRINRLFISFYQHSSWVPLAFLPSR